MIGDSMYEYKCTIVKVIDGDTTDVDIDLGFGVWMKKQRIRFYGVDTPDKDQLIAALKTIAEITADIGADSLGFISIDGLYRAMGETARNGDNPQFCDACFTGDYPIKLASGLSSKRVSHGNSR